MQPSNPAHEYLRTRVLTASPEELRLMLLDGAIKFAMKAREGLESKNHEAIYSGFTSCRNIVTELLTSIRSDPNPALAEKVRALYSFIFKLLVEAAFEKDIAKLDKAIELLQYERETWVVLMQKVSQERAAASNSNEPRVALSVQG
jgi:flagellar protein FliS